MSKNIANPSFTPIPHPAQPYTTFNDFYPFYLGEHSNRINRIFHLFGTTGSVLVNTRLVLSAVPLILRRLNIAVKGDLGQTIQSLSLTGGEAGKLALGGVVFGYACAWIGHFFVEKNRPATFTYPLMSLRGDLRMLYEVLTLQRAP